MIGDVADSVVLGHFFTCGRRYRLSSDTQSSSRKKRLDAIVDALVKANEYTKKFCKCPLNRMPEYFMAARVAEHFAENFKNFGFRLEASVKSTLMDARLDESEIDSLLREEELRGNGRFDLVLRTGRRGVPAHVFEFKRGSRDKHLLNDLIRLAYVSEKVPERTRLETNYLVCTTRKTKAELGEMLKRQQLERESTKKHLREGVTYSLERYQDIDFWMNAEFQETSKRFAIAVFEVGFKR